jgi:hypothetical protein
VAPALFLIGAVEQMTTSRGVRGLAESSRSIWARFSTRAI